MFPPRVETSALEEGGGEAGGGGVGEGGDTHLDFLPPDPKVDTIFS